MNTSKQVNAMIGLMFLVAVFFAANVLNEPNRQETALEEQTDVFVERGAEIFVQNCRSCHGLEGLGPEEGAIAPALNIPAFLILGEDNEFGAEPTAIGVADGIRDFLGNSIACGRTNTAMPVWGDQFGGSLSPLQIEYLVTLITEGEWEVVTELGHDEDEHQIPPRTREDVISDGTGLARTTENCGQFNALTAKPFRERDPFATTPDPDGTAEPGETPDPDETPTGGGPADAQVQGLPVGDFYLASCSTCHGQSREGLIGPALTPDSLTEPDDFYIETIVNGRAGTAMAAYGGGVELTDEEVAAIVTWAKNVEP
jgi:mono/diheme cytochrome c family protein